MQKHKFDYKWTLKDAVFSKDKGNVFSCFACGMSVPPIMMAQVATQIWEQWLSKI